MTDAIRIEGLRELRRGLKQIEKSAPRELNKAIKASVSDIVLPQARSQTPRASGALAGATRVGSRGDRITLRNPKPYANTIHWGRLAWPRQGHPRAVPSPVKGTHFLTGSIDDNRFRIASTVVEEIEQLIDRSFR